MDSLRAVFGLPTSSSASNKTPSVMRSRAESQQKGVTVQDQLQQQVNASEVKLKVNAARISKAERDKQQAVATKNKPFFDMAVRELDAASAETKTLEALLNNQRAQLRLHQEAQANIEMAITMRAGAEELSAATEAMEDLNVEDTMDTLRDAASTVGEHSRILSDPITSETAATHPLDVDQEWQRLVAEQQQQQQQPSAVVSTVQPATVPVATRVAAKEVK